MLVLKQNIKYIRYSVFMNCNKRPVLNNRLIKQKSVYGSDYLRTNMMADYLDKMSTDINYITYLDDDDTDNSESYIQLIIIIAILLYMFWSSSNKNKDKDNDNIS